MLNEALKRKELKKKTYNITIRHCGTWKYTVKSKYDRNIFRKDCEEILQNLPVKEIMGLEFIKKYG